MMYGLTKTHAMFIDLMNRMFREYLEKFIIVFIDDSLVHLLTMEEHELHLKIVLGKLREKRLCAKFSKCKFNSEKSHFLGTHCVERENFCGSV